VQEFQELRVLEPALRMKAQVDSNSRGQKDFICKEEKRREEKKRERKDCILENAGGPETGYPVGQIGEWGFIAFFCIGWGQRCLAGADRHFLGRRDVSLTTYHLLGPPAVRPSVLHSPPLNGHPKCC
jgi:hypothetical protein